MPAMTSPLFCDPHLKRLGLRVPAEYLVDGEHFCSACFSGADPSRRDLSEWPGPRLHAEPVAQKPEHTHHRAYFTRQEILALMTQAKAVRERDWILFLVSFWHGLRASEAISLTPEHFAGAYLALQRLGRSLRAQLSRSSRMNASSSMRKRRSRPGSSATKPLTPATATAGACFRSPGFSSFVSCAAMGAWQACRMICVIHTC